MSCIGFFFFFYEENTHEIPHDKMAVSKVALKSKNTVIDLLGKIKQISKAS